jgi:hypothetical protein
MHLRHCGSTRPIATPRQLCPRYGGALPGRPGAGSGGRPAGAACAGHAAGVCQRRHSPLDRRGGSAAGFGWRAGDGGQGAAGLRCALQHTLQHPLQHPLQCTVRSVLPVQVCILPLCSPSPSYVWYQSPGSSAPCAVLYVQIRHDVWHCRLTADVVLYPQHWTGQIRQKHSVFTVPSSSNQHSLHHNRLHGNLIRSR